MPRGDGTGPMGQGSGKGRWMARKQGGGGGRMGGFALGPGGNCICLNCGNTVPHQQGVPCGQVKCPKCETRMNRERVTT